MTNREKFDKMTNNEKLNWHDLVENNDGCPPGVKQEAMPKYAISGCIKKEWWGSYYISCEACWKEYFQSEAKE